MENLHHDYGSFKKDCSHMDCLYTELQHLDDTLMNVCLYSLPGCDQLNSVLLQL